MESWNVDEKDINDLYSYLVWEENEKLSTEQKLSKLSSLVDFNLLSDNGTKIWFFMKKLGLSPFGKGITKKNIQSVEAKLNRERVLNLLWKDSFFLLSTLGVYWVNIKRNDLSEEWSDILKEISLLKKLPDTISLGKESRKDLKWYAWTSMGLFREKRLNPPWNEWTQLDAFKLDTYLEKNEKWEIKLIAESPWYWRFNDTEIWVLDPKNWITKSEILQIIENFQEEENGRRGRIEEKIRKEQENRY